MACYRFWLEYLRGFLFLFQFFSSLQPQNSIKIYVIFEVSNFMALAFYNTVLLLMLLLCCAVLYSFCSFSFPFFPVWRDGLFALIFCSALEITVFLFIASSTQCFVFTIAYHVSAHLHPTPLTIYSGKVLLFHVRSAGIKEEWNGEKVYK